MGYKIVADFHLFIRDDIYSYSDNPYDADKIQDAEGKLSEYVVSIVQDYQRKWNDDFLDQVLHKPEDEPNNIVWNDSMSSSAQVYRMVLKEVTQVMEMATPKKVYRMALKEVTQVMKMATPKKFSTSGVPSSDANRDLFVAFIDIGFELKHPNLINSTSLSISHSFISGGKDVTPELYSPDVKGEWGDVIYEKLSHGTSCMGLVGATADNGCDRGVAPNVKLVGLRTMQIDGNMTDNAEARALSYQWEKIDVFSCSYGIRDNIGFYEPKEATKMALMEGATKGHDCRGVLYIYPSGNGHLDNCNADGYANSIYTITIAQVQKNGHLPGNTEICSAAIAATRGNGYCTTKLNGKCSAEFEGSSASCAVAAGLVGELIFYSPYLSKRDIEHIMVKTARINDNIRWSTNGVGRKYNDQIGFGVLDLGRMLKAAINWKYVPQIHTCTIQPKDTDYQHVTGFNWISKNVVISDGCRNKTHHVQYLEHVEVEMNLRCSNIFHVAIRLISPLGTVSNILTSMNISKGISKSFNKLHWNFTSVHFWGEQPSGPWTVEVMVENSSVEVECKYKVTKLVLHGTDMDPEKGRDVPLTCEGMLVERVRSGN